MVTRSEPGQAGLWKEDQLWAFWTREEINHRLVVGSLGCVCVCCGGGSSKRQLDWVWLEGQTPLCFPPPTKAACSGGHTVHDIHPQEILGNQGTLGMYPDVKHQSENWALAPSWGYSPAGPRTRAFSSLSFLPSQLLQPSLRTPVLPPLFLSSLLLGSAFWAKVAFNLRLQGLLG